MHHVSQVMKDHKKVESMHNVCLLTVIQLMLTYGVSTLILSTTLTGLIFIRQAGIILLIEDTMSEL